MTTAPSYRKTKSGEWVVFGPAASVRLGQVAVSKRDGAAKVETVAKLGKPFRVDGVECVYGYIAPKQASRSGGPVRPSGSYECDECGDRVQPGTRCWETGMAH